MESEQYKLAKIAYLEYIGTDRAFKNKSTAFIDSDDRAQLTAVYENFRQALAPLSPAERFKLKREYEGKQL